MTASTPTRPWPALWALVIGFFMILLDTTIVSVANPAIMKGLDLTDYSSVIWVTSAYLLAAAVPLLVTGRLGDRFGPKTIYLIGLTLFTSASAACGLAGTASLGVGVLIGARVVQGLGAAMMTPQTMAVITRTFPPDARGAAMGLWGAVAGVASLVGPILGGVLVDALGWEWIFFINVPVGVIGFVAVVRLVPKLPTHEHSFDMPGVVLSAIGLFLVIFAIQEGDTYDWGAIVGPVQVWMLIALGVVVLAAFVWWQARNRREPLLPLGLFRDRNFSLADVAISCVGFTVTSMSLPLMFFYQTARGLSPTQAALMMAPTAVISGVGSPLVGRALTRTNARWIAMGSLSLMAVGLVWYSLAMSATGAIWWLLGPAAVVGVANAGMWGPLSTTATRNLAPRDAGAGAGVYNTTRQVGSVLGSACVAALIQARLAVNMPSSGQATGMQAAGSVLPAFLREPFSTSMAQTLMLPACVVLLAAAVVAFFEVPTSIADVHRLIGERPATAAAGRGTGVASPSEDAGRAPAGRAPSR